MGSAASKPARSAAGAAARQYPKRPAPPPKAPPAPAPKETPVPPTPSQSPNPEPASATSQSQRAPNASSQGPVYHSKEPPSVVKSPAIDLDGRDPDFAASLRKIGPVDPSTNYQPPHVHDRGSVQTVFPTSSNPALLAITARDKITKAAQEETAQMGLANFPGRQFLDSLTIHQALTMRDQQRLPHSEIERLLRLKKGTVARFGKAGIVSPAA
ncbi:hypothetical protein N7468_006518 [Penicillium chermesinum]|uniref:Helix-turn-helix domain-containing protein n=1 Tax=Penicillium chermesinum TaxID=63820 RepID=A0A9W9NUQ8_9EURO|nr:uncharacterized protein N7468_006518 [Penicillium chermesinum]KAJ5225293.1 hypothetical protein N7468_006518 [Penicillium chermesinum]